MRIIRNRHFWLILVLFVFCSVLHYAELMGIPGTTEPSFRFGLTRHALDRILFLVPIIYSAYIFRLAGGLGTSFAALLVMLPRATLLSPVPADAILETASVILVGVLASLWGWTLVKAKGKTETALAQLQSAHEILQHYVQSVRSNEKRQSILNSISTMLGESLELENILNKAIHMVSELMEVEVTLIFSLDTESQELKLVAHEGVSDEFARAVDGIKIGEGFYGEVAQTGQPMVVENVSRDSRLTKPEVNRMRLQIQLIVPMIIRDSTTGIVCIAMRRPRQFTPEDIELLTAVGTQIAAAVENARLYEKEHLTAQKLAVSQDNLRYYLQEITRAQEEERKRIARELHDVTAQTLYALNRQVDNFVRSNTNLPTANAAFLEDLGKQVREVLQDVRRFGQDLRPPMLDDLGLLAALRWLVSELKEHGIETDLKVLGTERRFTPETELVLFRIVQEAMRNIGRHSKASKAEATIEFGDGRTRVSITDNGVGFHLPESLEDLSRAGKLGLIGMQERMRLLDGRIRIESEPGKGTTVMVEIPI